MWDSNPRKSPEPEEEKEWFPAVVNLSVVVGAEILLELNEDVGTQVAALSESKITCKGNEVGSVTVTAASLVFDILGCGEEEVRADEGKRMSQLLPACFPSHLKFLHDRRQFLTSWFDNPQFAQEIDLESKDFKDLSEEFWRWQI